MGQPAHCPDPTCDQVHPNGCLGHVEDCTACGWRGRNYVDKPCRKCGGEVRRRPCTQHPRKGQTKCNSHGGGSPQALAAAEQREARRLAERQAAQTLADVGVTPIGDPLDALAQVAAEAVALKDHFANLVAELNKNMSFETWADQKLDARVALYERALDRAHRFLADWVRLGFEERKAQLDDARALLVRTVLVGVLSELGHQVDDLPARTALERWLPVLDGEPPPAITP